MGRLQNCRCDLQYLHQVKSRYHYKTAISYISINLFARSVFASVCLFLCAVCKVGEVVGYIFLFLDIMYLEEVFGVLMG